MGLLLAKSMYWIYKGEGLRNEAIRINEPNILRLDRITAVSTSLAQLLSYFVYRRFIFCYPFLSIAVVLGLLYHFVTKPTPSLRVWLIKWLIMKERAQID